MLAFGDTPEKAIKAPRVHNQLQPNVTEYENITGITSLTLMITSAFSRQHVMWCDIKRKN